MWCVYIYIRTHSIHLCVCVCVHDQRHVQSKVNYSWFLAIGSLFCRTLQSTNQSPLPPGWLIDLACVTTNNLPKSLELEFQPQSGMHTHKSGIPERIESRGMLVTAQSEPSLQLCEPCLSEQQYCQCQNMQFCGFEQMAGHAATTHNKFWEKVCVSERLHNHNMLGLRFVPWESISFAAGLCFLSSPNMNNQSLSSTFG